MTQDLLLSHYQTYKLNYIFPGNEDAIDCSLALKPGRGGGPHMGADADNPTAA